MLTEYSDIALPLTIAGHLLQPGCRMSLDLSAASLPTGSRLSLPVHALCGDRPGPRVLLTATTHGDELNGLEIIHRVLKRVTPEGLSGSIIAVPVMNVLGFMDQTRTLPDGSDLNRSFPGSPKGSVAEQLADFFMREIAEQCEFGIDLHSGANNRLNPPQIRAALDDPQTRQMAEAFGAPLIMNTPLASGSLRAAALKRGIRALLFEGGEPLRFNRDALECGEAGVMRVLHFLRMIKHSPYPPSEPSVEVLPDAIWLKAPRCGILRPHVEVNQVVHAGDVVGVVSDVLGDGPEDVIAPFEGMVIGITLNPFVAKDGGILHLAKRLQ